MLFIIKRYNDKELLLSVEDLRQDKQDIIYALFIGLGLGILFPIIGTFGYFFPDTVLYELHELAIKQMLEHGSKYSFFQYSLLIFCGTVLFSVLREILFRGIIFKLFLRDMNVTFSTIQVSIFFTMMYFTMQFNTLDVLTLLISSVVLCFVTYRTQSIIPAIVISITNDIPLLTIIHTEAFKQDPNSLIVFNSEHIWIYLLALGTTIYFLKQLELKYTK